MNLSDEITIPAPRARVYEALQDPARPHEQRDDQEDRDRRNAGRVAGDALPWLGLPAHRTRSSASSASTNSQASS